MKNGDDPFGEILATPGKLVQYVGKDNFDLNKGGVKFDLDKPRWDLFQWGAAEEVVRVSTYGAKKYDDWNWAKGMRWGRCFSAALRHLCKWVTGESIDPESGLSHLAHAAWNILSLLDFELNKTGEDDRHIWVKK